MYGSGTLLNLTFDISNLLFQHSKKSGRVSRFNFLRRRSFGSGRVLNLNNISTIRRPGYESGIKFVMRHNTEAGNDTKFNFFIPRYGSGTLLKFIFVISNLFVQQSEKLCRESSSNHNSKFLHYNHIGIKLVKRDGCPERMCGSGQLINSNLSALNHCSKKCREFCGGSGLILKLNFLSRKQTI